MPCEAFTITFAGARATTCFSKEKSQTGGVFHGENGGILGISEG